MTKTKADNEKRAWVICAEPQLVFFGYATESELESEAPWIENLRLCVRWSESTRGVIGLASVGPRDGSRVTPAAPGMRLRNRIEGYIECTPEAIERWEAGPWG